MTRLPVGCKAQEPSSTFPGLVNGGVVLPHTGVEAMTVQASLTSDCQSATLVADTDGL